MSLNKTLFEEEQQRKEVIKVYFLNVIHGYYYDFYVTFEINSLFHCQVDNPYAGMKTACEFFLSLNEIQEYNLSIYCEDVLQKPFVFFVGFFVV